MVDRYKRLAPLSAVFMVGGVLTAILTPQTPDSTASGAKVIAFYQHHHTAMYVAAFALAYAAAAAILYFVSVASFLRRKGSDLLATTTVMGAALLAVGLLLGSGSLAAANDAPGRMSPDVARALNVVQSDVFAPALFAGLGIAVLSAGVAMLRTNALPTALGVITVIVGVAEMSGILSWPALMVCGPLTLVIAGYVYHELGKPPEITLPEAGSTRTKVSVPTQTAPV